MRMTAVNGDLTLKGQMHDVVERWTFLSNNDICAAHLSPCRPQTQANKCALESHSVRRKQLAVFRQVVPLVLYTL